MEPRNTEYLALRALQLDYDGADSTALLERAAELSPLSSAPRIRLGLAAEIRGDNSRRRKDGCWMRRESIDSSSRVGRSRISISAKTIPRTSGRRCATRSTSATAIDGPRSICVGAWGFIYHPYAGDSGSARSGCGVSRLRTGIASGCDRAGRDEACGLQRSWRSSDCCWQPTIPSSRPTILFRRVSFGERSGSSEPSGITNGDFTSGPLNHGFDWRLVESPGVTHTPIEQPQRAHRIMFDGRQPESAALLSQVLLLEARAHYALRWESRTNGLPSPSGVEWRIGDQRIAIEGTSATFVAGKNSSP